jgi:hypothetical protein
MTQRLGGASYFLSRCPGRCVAVNELASHGPLPNVPVQRRRHAVRCNRLLGGSALAPEDDVGGLL